MRLADLMISARIDMKTLKSDLGEAHKAVLALRRDLSKQEIKLRISHDSGHFTAEVKKARRAFESEMAKHTASQAAPKQSTWWLNSRRGIPVADLPMPPMPKAGPAPKPIPLADVPESPFRTKRRSVAEMLARSRARRAAGDGGLFTPESTDPVSSKDYRHGAENKSESQANLIKFLSNKDESKKQTDLLRKTVAGIMTLKNVLYAVIAGKLVSTVVNWIQMGSKSTPQLGYAMERGATVLDGFKASAGLAIAEALGLAGSLDATKQIAREWGPTWAEAIYDGVAVCRMLWDIMKAGAATMEIALMWPVWALGKLIVAIGAFIETIADLARRLHMGGTADVLSSIANRTTEVGNIMGTPVEAAASTLAKTPKALKGDYDTLAKGPSKLSTQIIPLGQGARTSFGMLSGAAMGGAPRLMPGWGAASGQSNSAPAKTPEQLHAVATDKVQTDMASSLALIELHTRKIGQIG